MDGTAMTVLAALTIACAVANAGIAVADLRKVGFVLANSAEVGVGFRWLPHLGAVKMAGAGGLVLGLVAAPWLGLAAAFGLVVFFIGAVGLHLRMRVFHNIAFPATFLMLAVAACAYFIGSVAWPPA
jgi:hypothetical protein